MLTIGMIVAFASLYYKWGEMEYGSGVIMAALSAGVSGAALFLYTPYKLVAIFGAQVLLGLVFLVYHFTRR
ncbi:MAG TPA: hypothetical protein VM733_21435 [Thermoanaerobaculia bacterium]|nr:hypothetical protein [Thermoanaerobaculia bacterium]